MFVKRAQIPKIKNKKRSIIDDNITNSRYKGKPGPKKASSFLWQDNGNSSLSWND
jgi:hypothetical protein